MWLQNQDTNWDLCFVKEWQEKPISEECCHIDTCYQNGDNIVKPHVVAFDKLGKRAYLRNWKSLKDHSPCLVG